MIYPVRVTSAAWRDLKDIYDWIADNESLEKAGSVFDQLWEATDSIAKLPQRGSRPKELAFGIQPEYRQVFFKHYRVIYEVRREEVVIHLIADGRRNLQSLLLRRLIG